MLLLFLLLVVLVVLVALVVLLVVLVVLHGLHCLGCLHGGLCAKREEADGMRSEKNMSTDGELSLLP